MSTGAPGYNAGCQKNPKMGRFKVKQIKHVALAGIMAITLTGCSVFDWLVYKIDIPQGNFIEQTQVDQVQIGMNREQISYILGSPVIRDSFDRDTWYYVYQYKSGETHKTEQKDLIIKFQKDQVTHISGSYTE